MLLDQLKQLYDVDSVDEGSMHDMEIFYQELNPNTRRYWDDPKDGGDWKWKI
ncbi:hypothetical protein BJ508DRAFT_419065 [Ascobolus immersus RN42]|uniref:Uncharacterized protein n=1 Tax=Ascobolus immersus RN42 TaxID=1160509 RepID=A0A3N4HNJ4_ASCIM|nr:hypothetical protein BJ508DRAFT_419065 [Ascobolus immersus RN42]